MMVYLFSNNIPLISTAQKTIGLYAVRNNSKNKGWLDIYSNQTIWQAHGEYDVVAQLGFVRIQELAEQCLETTQRCSLGWGCNGISRPFRVVDIRVTVALEQIYGVIALAFEIVNRVVQMPLI